jgi:hypothetical protein
VAFEVLREQNLVVLLRRPRTQKDAAFVAVGDGHSEECRVELHHDLGVGDEQSDVA